MFPTFVRLVETLTRDWLNTNEPRENGDANNHIVLHHQLTNHNIDELVQQLTLESLYTNSEQTPLNICQPLRAPYKCLIHDVNETDKRTSITDRLNLTNNRRTFNRLQLTDWNRPMTDDKLNTNLSANTIMANLTNQFQRTRVITSSRGKHYLLDFRSGCRNVSHQQ